MNDIAKFIEELVAKNVADVLGMQTRQCSSGATFDISGTSSNVAMAPTVGATAPLLAQLSPRERLVMMSRYRIPDALGQCLTPNEVMRVLRLSTKEYDAILATARKKLV